MEEYDEDEIRGFLKKLKKGNDVDVVQCTSKC